MPVRLDGMAAESFSQIEFCYILGARDEYAFVGPLSDLVAMLRVVTQVLDAPRRAQHHNNSCHTRFSQDDAKRPGGSLPREAWERGG